MSKDVISEALEHIFNGISKLREEFKKKHFTIDGRLVGDIGEVIAERDFDIILHKKQKPYSDAVTSDGKKEVQIKATFKDTLTFKKSKGENGESLLYLGFKLNEDGSYEVIYNGPCDLIAEKFSHRKGLEKDLLSFSIKSLSELSKKIPDNERVRRKGQPP